MKKQQDIIDHAVSATGLGKPEVRRVLDAAFAYVRASALAGEDVSYPGLGKIKVRSRTTPGGEAKTIYRFDPSETGGAGTGAKTGKADGGKPAGAKAGAGVGKGAGRRRAAAAPDGETD